MVSPIRQHARRSTGIRWPFDFVPTIHGGPARGKCSVAWNVWRCVGASLCPGVCLRHSPPFGPARAPKKRTQPALPRLVILHRTEHSAAWAQHTYLPSPTAPQMPNQDDPGQRRQGKTYTIAPHPSPPAGALILVCSCLSRATSPSNPISHMPQQVQYRTQEMPPAIVETTYFHREYVPESARCN